MFIVFTKNGMMSVTITASLSDPRNSGWTFNMVHPVVLYQYIII